MHKFIVVIIFLFLKIIPSFTQDKNKLYDPQLNGIDQIKAALNKAKKENKFVMIQIGGNWCPWCIKFNKFCTEIEKIDTLIKNNFILIHLNYSKENKNIEAMQMLGNPQRFGFPVIVILDTEGNRIHTQDTSFLEVGNSYDTTKVIRFLSLWTPRALNKK
ncbi:MAG: thioredoxin family protein [Bacteroidales bacterium]|nr:thioredoxin family protein [Bacteroidales bacterium]